MVAQIKTITSVTEHGLDVIKKAQDDSTAAFNSFADLKLRQILEDKFKPLVDAIVRLADATEQISHAVGDTKDRPSFTGQQDQVFLCMRTLNRVEDLTIDKDPGRNENNTELRRIDEDALVQACLEVLNKAEDLKRRVTVVHREFPESPPQGEIQDRLERFWEIQELRSDIIAHFAAQSAAAPGNPGPAVE